MNRVMTLPGRGLCLVSAALLSVAAWSSVRTEATRPVDYLRDVRPILAHYCFACHGPDEATREADLRLDLRESAFAEHGEKAIIKPGDPERSLLLTRMRHEDPKRHMPPPSEAKQPSAAEIATLETWIREGATWQEHWAFVAPILPSIPQVKAQSWVRNPLDAFVLERLERENLSPSPEASREAWLRRASLDLTGLPPTPAELDAFLADNSENAHEKQVDRLLASPRYGEHQAHSWLDLARYADSSGYQNDEPRKIWKWREWVVQAFNSNMPFDQFTIEQLAGDLLPNATLSQKVATGFNRNHPTNSEAGEEEDEYRSAYVIDRVNTTSTAFLGLTLACTQCHDHKYDALSQRDYYSFYSFFNNINERDSDFGNPRPKIPVPNPDQEPRLADLKSRIETLKARLEQDDPLVDAAQRAWEQKTLAALGEPIPWVTLEPSGMLARNGSLLKRLEDGSIRSEGTAPVKDVYDIMFQPGKKRITALRLEVLPDEQNPEKGLGRASDGRFVLSALELRLSTLSESEDPPLVYISSAQADLNQKRKEEPNTYEMFPGSIESAIVVEALSGGAKDFRRGGGGWSIVDDERRRPHEAVLLPIEPLETNEASVLRWSLHQTSSQKFKSLIGRLRISITEDPRIRTQLLPAYGKLWSSLGPFAAEDAATAFSTSFAPEKGLGPQGLDLKQSYDKVVLKPAATKEAAAPEKAQAAADAQAAAPMGTKPLPKPIANQPSLERTNVAVVAAKPVTETPKPAEKSAEKPDKAEKPAPPEKITWTEQRVWRDGNSARLEGSNVAWYVTRKIHSTQARTVRVHIDGPAGLKLWVNGEAAVASAPPPPLAEPSKKPADSEKAEAKPDKSKDKDSEDDDPMLMEPEEFDIAKFFGDAPSASEKDFRIGLRAGENEILIKLIYAKSASNEGRREGGGGMGMMGPPSGGRRDAGGSFSFRMTPEGEDVITHEVATALRWEALGVQDSMPVVGSSGEALSETATADSDDPKISKVGELAAPLRKSETINPLTPSERRRKVIREHYRTTMDPAGRVLAAELAKLKEEERELKRLVPETLVMEELEKPRQAYIFGRGLYKNRGADVEPGTPAVLPPMDADLPKNRLGLARWLVSGKNPLTARVLINRVWQQYFGIGLVRTAEDFGVRSELPTHPELLDWLAVDFVQHGWDLKRLHKQIVLSATYRQDAAIQSTSLERDPENRLLARGPRLRLSAEMVRDQALALSGLLVEKIGGESVKPRQPKNAWKTVEGSRTGEYVRHRDERQYRRSVYIYWKRGAPYPSMLNFDAAKRDGCTVTRATTTTPLQALTLLNDPVYVECAKRFAQRLLTERQALGRARDPKPEEQDALRLAYGFRMATSRAPSAEEAQLLAALLAEQRASYKSDVESAKKLLKVGDASVSSDLDPVELAAWTQVASALLNLDAALHRG